MKNKFYQFLFLLFFIFSFIPSGFSQYYGWTNYAVPTMTYNGILKDNNIWIPSTGGVIKFDTITKHCDYFNSYNSPIPCNNVCCVIKDNNNNLWFGTGGETTGYNEATLSGRGLVKYDGNSWTVYKNSNSGLPSNNIRSLFADSLNNIWIGTNGAGLAKYNGSQWVVYTPGNSGLRSDTISSLIADKNGTLWIGTFNGLVSFDGTNWTVFSKQNSGLVGDTIRTVFIAPNNEKWIGTSRGLSRFDGNNWTSYTTSNSGLPHKNIVSITMDTSGVVWLGTYGMAETYAKGVVTFDGVNWVNYNDLNSGLPRNNVSTVLIDEFDTKWIISERGAKKGDGQAEMNCFRNGIWSKYPLANAGFLVNNTYCITKDSTNALWFGGEKGGITKFDGANWSNYNTENSNLIDDDGYDMEFDRNGLLWITHDRGHYSTFNGTSFTSYNTPNGITDDPYSFTIDKNNVKWFGCRGTGLLRYDDSTWINYTTSNSGLPHNLVQTVETDSAGNIWVGTNAGLAMFDGSTWTVYTTSNSGLPNNIVLGIEILKNNIKWISTYTGLAKFDGVNWTVYASGLPSSRVYCSKQDTSGVLWVGTYTGVGKQNGSGFVTLTNFSGAPYEAMKDIEIDQYGNIWVASLGAGVAMYDHSVLLTEVPLNRAFVSNSFSLEVAPNPLREQAIITVFTNNNESNFSIRFFDVTGNEINVSYSHIIAEGKHTYTINAGRINDGIYFYEVSNGFQTKNGKLTIIK